VKKCQDCNITIFIFAVFVVSLSLTPTVKCSVFYIMIINSRLAKAFGSNELGHGTSEPVTLAADRSKIPTATRMFLASRNSKMLMRTLSDETRIQKSKMVVTKTQKTHCSASCYNQYSNGITMFSGSRIKMGWQTKLSDAQLC